MNSIDPPHRNLPRAIALVGIVGLHLLLYGLLLQLPGAWRPQPNRVEAASPALLLWQVPRQRPIEVVQAVVPAVVIDVKTDVNTRPVRGQPAAAKRPPAQAPDTVKVPEPVPEQVIATLPAPAATTRPPADSTALPPAAPTIPDGVKSALTEQTRRELARVASELRKESYFPADFNAHAKPDKLTQGIAAAWRGDGGTTITNIKLPDGRVMTKVSGPLGSYCAYKDSVGHTGGRDQMQNGVPTKTTTCPR